MILKPAMNNDNLVTRRRDSLLLQAICKVLQMGKKERRGDVHLGLEWELNLGFLE